MKRVSYEDVTLAGATSRDVSAKNGEAIRPRQFFAETSWDVFATGNVRYHCHIEASVKETTLIYTRCEKTQPLYSSRVFFLYESMKKLYCYISIQFSNAH
jgi:hypothetical protein